MSSSAARVWMTTGLPSLARDCELALEQLAAARRAARSRGSSRGPVSPTATAFGWPSSARNLGHMLRFGAAGFVRMDAEARVDAVVRVGERESVVRPGERGRDRDDALRRRPRGRGRCTSARRRRGARGCRSRFAAHPAKLLLGDRVVELAEERSRLEQNLPGGQVARLPAADPVGVVAGQDLVRAAVLLGRPRGTRAGRR